MDRRSFLKGFGVAGVATLFGVVPLHSWAAEPLKDVECDKIWLKKKLAIAAQDIDLAFKRATQGYLQDFMQVEEAVGFPVIDQLTTAFLETRIGETNKNLFMYEPATFVMKFAQFMPDMIVTVDEHDAALGKRVRDVLANPDLEPLAKAIQENRPRNYAKNRALVKSVMSFSSNPFVSALITACRIDEGRKEVQEKIENRVVQRYVGKGLGYLVHNVGEMNLMCFMRRPEAKVTDTMPVDQVQNRGMYPDIRAASLVDRTAKFYVGVRDMLAERAQEEGLNRPSATTALRSAGRRLDGPV